MPLSTYLSANAIFTTGKGDPGHEERMGTHQQDCKNDAPSARVPLASEAEAESSPKVHWPNILSTAIPAGREIVFILDRCPDVWWEPTIACLNKPQNISS